MKSSFRERACRYSALLLIPFLLLCIPVPPASAQTTATMDITVTGSTPIAIYYPLNLTVSYVINLVDPVSGVVSALYPNRMLNVSSQELVTTGSYSINSLANTLTFYTGMNVSAGNFTANYRLIYDTTLMTNNTVDTTIHTYGNASYSITYYIPITLNNTGSTLTNYQVPVTVNTATPISQGKMRSDGGDIRFNDSDMATPLSYWLESGINTTSTNIWVKVPSIPTGTKTIYMYYGNSSATSTSNGTATFAEFDDFSGDLSAWSFSGSGWNISNGVLQYTGGATDYIYALRSLTHGNFTFEFKAYVGASNTEWAGGVFRSTDYSNLYQTSQGSTRTLLYIFKKVSDSFTSLTSTSFTWSLSTWYNVKVTAIGSALKTYVNNNLILSTTDTTFASGKCGFVTDGSDARFDDYRVRTMADPEPTCSVGSEQLLINYAYSVSYGQLSTESQLTVMVPVVGSQIIVANITANWTTPTVDSATIQMIASSQIGQYFLMILPIIILLAAAAKHTAAVVGAVVSGICLMTNAALGYSFYNTVLIGWILAMCVLQIVVEQRRGGD
jgi:hypothetical protein